MRQILILALLVLVAHGTRANNITMIPLQSTDVVAGQIFSMDIVFDFTTDPDLFLYGGAFDIDFDYEALEFVSVDLEDIGDPMFLREPDYYEGGPGFGSSLNAWAVGAFDGIPLTGRFGTVHFRVRDSMPATSLITASDSGSGIAPPWGCFDPSIPHCYIVPAYNQISLTRVPVPPAALLLASAVFGTSIFSKVKKRAI